MTDKTVKRQRLFCVGVATATVVLQAALCAALIIAKRADPWMTPRFSPPMILWNDVSSAVTALSLPTFGCALLGTVAAPALRLRVLMGICAVTCATTPCLLIPGAHALPRLWPLW